MANKALERLVQQAKEDPRFFHALVFDPESLLGQLDYLSRQEKGALVAINPESMIGRIIGEIADCTVTVQCTSTCTHTSSLEEGFNQVINPALRRG